MQTPHPFQTGTPDTRDGRGRERQTATSMEAVGIWTGRALTALLTLFLLGASIAPKLLQLPLAEETLASLGWPEGQAFSIGLLELTLLILYLVPRTSVLGAVLMTGLLGGAMATQIRAGSPLFSHVLFSIYLGLFLWGGLWLRDPALRRLFPFRR